MSTYLTPIIYNEMYNVVVTFGAADLESFFANPRNQYSKLHDFLTVPLITWKERMMNNNPRRDKTWTQTGLDDKNVNWRPGRTNSWRGPTYKTTDTNNTFTFSVVGDPKVK